MTVRCGSRAWVGRHGFTYLLTGDLALLIVAGRVEEDGFKD